jgi:hypothetical protein
VALAAEGQAAPVGSQDFCTALLTSGGTLGGPGWSRKAKAGIALIDCNISFLGRSSVDLHYWFHAIATQGDKESAKAVKTWRSLPTDSMN